MDSKSLDALMHTQVVQHYMQSWKLYSLCEM